MCACCVLSRSVVSNSCSPPGSSVHGDSPAKNTGVGCHALLQGIFPTQGSNPGLPHCRQIPYHLSPQGYPYKKGLLANGGEISAEIFWASLVAHLVKNLPAMRETWIRSLGWEDPLEKEKTTHSRILAWRIPWAV